MTRRGLAVALLLAGCASPPPRLFTIAPVQGEAAPGAPSIILLRDIGLARYLERSQIVRSSEGYRLDVLANDWWGEPLAAMLARVLVQELDQRLPGSIVYGENGAVTTPPDATIELNIQRLDQDSSGQLVLLAQAAVIRHAQPEPVTRLVRAAVTPAGSGTGAEVAAISAAVGQLADALAAMLRLP